MGRSILECKDCGARYDVTDREPGSKVRCKACRAVLKVPKRDKSQTGRMRIVPEGESARSIRAKKLKEKFKDELSTQLSADSGKDPSHDEELRDNEQIQGLARPFRAEALKPIGVIKSFLQLLQISWTRLALLGFTTLGMGLVIAIGLVLIVAVLFGQGVAAAQILAGVLAILSAVAVPITEGAGVIIGRRALDERDEGLALERGFKPALKDCLRSSRKSLSHLFPLLGADLVFWLGAVLLGLVFFIGLAIPAIGTGIALLLLIPFVVIFVLLGIYSRLVAVGVLVEQRSFRFSLSRAAVLLRDPEIIKPLLVLSFLQAPVAGLLVGLYQGAVFVLTFLFVNNDPQATQTIAFALALFFGKALSGLFYTALHFELTKDEGLG